MGMHCPKLVLTGICVPALGLLRRVELEPQPVNVYDEAERVTKIEYSILKTCHSIRMITPNKANSDRSEIQNLKLGIGGFSFVSFGLLAGLATFINGTINKRIIICKTNHFKK
ncbi:hypothetical protein BpHYR1_013455 [Brachionus plicatilis]|uniref:Uncharacterized protein n=1 Tax=Brachionus plicatilis TaxID=10195 RepID=A0A3M7QUW5_BRAPC|nr:hypothetical protein BpHYR1_013455 [Brachionus plicatilis]